MEFIMENLRNTVLHCLENIGIDVSELVANTTTDVNLLEYINESITYITFIVELEEKLNLQIPDEFLQIEKLTSLNGFLEMLDSII